MTLLAFFGPYDFLARNSLILVLAGISVYLMLNAGLFAVPQVGLMSIGSYTAAILSVDHQMGLAVTLPASMAAGAVVGLLLGGILARLNGVYLAIATIAFSEMVRVTVQNLDITGGPVGLVGIEQSLNDLHIIGLLALVMVVIALVNRTRVGGAVRAMREDVLMASHQGINVRAYRAALFTVSGLVAGLAGGMQVHFTGYVEPSAFNFDLLVSLLTAAIVGGTANVCGPLVGGAVIFTLSQLLLQIGEYRNVVDGALMVAIIAFAPSGLVPILGRLASRAAAVVPSPRARGGRPASVALVPAAAAAGNGPPPDRVNGAAAAGQPAARPRPRLVPVTAGTPEHSAAVLEVDGLDKRFGGVQAVGGVSFSLRHGEAFGLIGPNGSGKTSLLNLLSGVYVPDRGTGRLAGTDMAACWGRPERLTKAGISRTFQNIRLMDDYSVVGNVRLGAYLSAPGLGRRPGRAPRGPADGRADDDLVTAAMDMVGITGLADAEAGSLPYGSKRKVEIARALVRRPSVLLLDEPTAGMTPAERDEIFELVQSIKAGGTAVIIVEHDVSSITKHCDRVAVLNFGQLIALGDPLDIIGQEAVINAYIGRAARA